jgi:hypothetical protein
MRPADAHALIAAARKISVALPAELGEIRYICDYPFAGGKAPHFLIKTALGKVTVLFLPRMRRSSRARANARGLEASVVRAPVGSVAIVGGSSASVLRVEALHIRLSAQAVPKDHCRPATRLTNAADNSVVHSARRRAFALIVVFCLAFQTFGTALAGPVAGGAAASGLHHASGDGCPPDHHGMPCGGVQHNCLGAHSCFTFALVAVNAANLLSGAYPRFSESSGRCTDRTAAVDVPPPLTLPA